MTDTPTPTQADIEALIGRLREHGKDAPHFSYRAMEDAVAALTALQAENAILRTEKHADAEAIGALQAERDAAVARAKTAEGNERVQHIKRGTTYRIIARGKLQTDMPLVDYTELVAYRCEETGDVWFRPQSEFTPDRFAVLAQLKEPKP